MAIVLKIASHELRRLSYRLRWMGREARFDHPAVSSRQETTQKQVRA